MPIIFLPTQESHLQHPQASKIPDTWWFDFDIGFSAAIDTALFPIFETTNFDEAIKLIEPLKERFDKDHLWLCVYYHLKLSLDEIQVLSASLAIHDSKLLMNCASEGRLDIIQKCLSNANCSDNEFFECFKKSCEKGHKEVAEWFFHNAGLNQATDDEKFLKAFWKAFCSNHLHIVEWIFDLLDEEKKQSILTNTIVEGNFLLTCTNGHLRTAEWLLIKADDNMKEMIAERIIKFGTFRILCAKNHSDVAQLLLKYIKIDISENNLHQTSFYWACYYNKQKTVQWLYALATNEDSRKALISDKDYECFRNGLGCKSSSIAEWLYERASPHMRREMIDSIIRNKDYEKICSKGLLSHAQWVYEKAEQDQKANIIRTQLVNSFSKALINNHIPMAEWLYERASPDTRREMIDSIIRNKDYEKICSDGLLSHAQWVYEKAEQDQKANIIRTQLVNSFSKALINNHIPMAEWLYSFFNGETLSENQIKHILNAACEKGHYASVQWLLLQLDNNPKQPGYIETAWFEPYAGHYISDRVLKLTKESIERNAAGNLQLKKEALSMLDKYMLQSVFPPPDLQQTTLNIFHNHTINDLELFISYVNSLGLQVKSLPLTHQIVKQKGPSCGYYAASYATAIWHASNKDKYPHFFARSSDSICKNKQRALYSRAKSYREKDKYVSKGFIPKLDDFKEILKDTGYRALNLACENPEDFNHKLTHLLDRACPVILPMDNGDSSYPGLTNGKNAHYICIIAYLKKEGQVCGYIYISHGALLYSSMMNLYLSNHNLNVFPISKITNDKNEKGFVDMEGIRGKMTCVFPDDEYEAFKALSF